MLQIDRPGRCTFLFGIGKSVPRTAAALCAMLASLIFATAGPVFAQSKIEKAGTVTTLAVTAAGSATTAIASGTLVTLTASVVGGSTTLTQGQINFCDASAAYCTDIHILGTAQLTKAGTAVLRFHPSVGSHLYKATFLGTKSFAGSSSAVADLAVNGTRATVTTIAASGTPGAYALTATVSGMGKTVPTAGPTGIVSFVDTTANNAVLRSARLGNATAQFGFVNVSNPVTGSLGGSIVVGDFNGDGNLDLAVGVSDGAVTAVILLGDGQGNFNAVTTGTVTAPGVPALVQDFNQDGIPDLLMTSPYGGSLTVILGNGDGTFRNAPNGILPSLYGTNPVVAADFNGDGIPDFATGGGYYLIVWLGNGDGTFTSLPTSSSIPIDVATSIVAGDFNDDGVADLAVLGISGNSVSIFLGNGDGTFTPGASITTGNPTTGSSSALTTGDFNKDGKLDLAVPIYADSGTMAILLGKGDGTFAAAPGSPVAIGAWSDRVAVGDFNGDGNEDIFLAGMTNQTNLTVMIGRGNGTFTQIATGSTYLPCCSNTVLGDFNGDGLTDLASSDFYSGSAAVFLTALTQASVTVQAISPVGPGPHQVVATYPGDSRYTAGVSSATPLVVQAAAPVITPNSGTYTSAVTVKITEATPGVTVYYALVGATNTTGWTVYKGPFTISAEGETLVWTYASAPGYQSSGQLTGTFLLNLPPAATPTISLAPGVYPATQTLTLTDATPGAVMYYTTNGSYAGTNAAKYTGPIQVATSETVTAAAIANGYSISAQASAQYIIGSSATSLIYTAAGTGISGYQGDYIEATSAYLNYPTATVLDSAGNLYIADAVNHRVRKVLAANGAIVTVAGDGVAGYAGDGRAATIAELSDPSSLALDKAGNLYIADRYDHVIRKVTAATGIISTYAGNGTFGFTGDGGLATEAELGSPAGIAFDAYGNLFISDSTADRIREVVAGTGDIRNAVGTGENGYTGDGGNPLKATLDLPSGLAFDSAGELFIADADNNVIRKVNAGFTLISTVAGNGYGANRYMGGYTGDGGLATNAELNYPTGVAVDAAGNLYIADANNNVVRKVTGSPGIISTYAGNGTNGQCYQPGGDGEAAASASFCYLQGISVSPAGKLYIASSGSSTIREVTPTALPPTAATAAPVFSLAAGSYPNAQKLTITDATAGATIYLTFDGSVPGNSSQIYSGPIAVTGSVTIRAVAVAPGYLIGKSTSAAYTIAAPATAVITTVAGNGGYSTSGVGGVATATAIGQPYAMAVDGAGNLYFSDFVNSVVWKVSAQTGKEAVVAGNGTQGFSGDGMAATSAQLYGPAGVAVDKAGNLYIADYLNSRVRMVAAGTGLISTVVGNGQYAFPGNNGDNGLAIDAELSGPVGLAFDSAGNLYIADANEELVRKVTASTSIITTFAGTNNFRGLGDGGLATNAYLNSPYWLAFDPSNNLYIETIADGRVRKVLASNGVISTIAGDGTFGAGTDGVLATRTEVYPDGLAVDAAGNVYISNYPASIREVSATTGLIQRVAGNNYPGFSGDGGSATIAGLNDPSGLAFDAAGNLYAADGSNFRIRKIVFTPAAAAEKRGSAASGVGHLK